MKFVQCNTVDPPSEEPADLNDSMLRLPNIRYWTGTTSGRGGHQRNNVLGFSIVMYSFLFEFSHVSCMACMVISEAIHTGLINS